MLNHITIMGRLVRDPELRRTGSGIAVTSFSVAVARDFGGNAGGYNAPAAPSYGSYSNPAPASDFAMLEDDDAQLPF